MSVRVTVRLADADAVLAAEVEQGRAPNGDDATAIAVKSATTGHEIAGLAEEAERLQQARHPGVVGFVDYRVVGDRAELHTGYAGESLERWSGTLAQIAGVAAAVATTLAELHEMGIVHGRVDRSHVLIGPDGRPKLCGFSPHEGAVEPADDVAAVGRILQQMIDEPGAQRSPKRDQTPWSVRGGARLARLIGLPGLLAERRALARVVVHATDPNPTRRPPARGLSRSILAAVPAAELPPASATRPQPPANGIAGPEPDRSDRFDEVFVDQTETNPEDVFTNRPWLDPSDRHVGGQRVEGGSRPQRSSGLSRLVVITATILGVLAVAVALGLRGARGGDQADDGEASGASPQSALDATSAASDTEVPCPPLAENDPSSPKAREVDVTGDGCAESVAIADGVITVDGERWAVGKPGDDIALGDWTCDGTATPAAYRRSTGDVFVFTDWAQDGRPLTVDPVARVEGGVSLAAVTATRDDAGGSCDVPAVEMRNGQRRVIDVTR